jgi:aryl-alcohol dehydrogenase-like predicted oxidoreductase
MKHRTLGRTGLLVSEIGHGLWGTGDWFGSDEQTCLATLHGSFERGCTFYDSAWSYGMGRSDELLGKLVATIPPGSIVTAGKVPPIIVNRPTSSRDRLCDVFPLEHVLEYAQRSCKKLGLSGFDLLQLHVWDDAWASDPLFETLASELKARKLCRFFGLSLKRGQPNNGLQAVKTGWVDTIQVVYNLFDQSPEDELFPLCAERNIGVIARVPLDEGSLGGQMTIDTCFPADDWRAKYFAPENLKEIIRRVDKLKTLVPKGVTLPELALRFVLNNPVVSTVIVGMRTVRHADEDVRASGAPPIDPSLMVALRSHRWDRAGQPGSA